MSQKSSVPQAAKFVSQALKQDTGKKILAPIERHIGIAEVNMPTASDVLRIRVKRQARISIP